MADAHKWLVLLHVLVLLARRDHCGPIQPERSLESESELAHRFRCQRNNFGGRPDVNDFHI